ncbi:MAG: membrane protein insertase YidC, partial [Polaribacter sp.]
MEQKKFDLNSFIGMLLLGGLLIWWMNTNKPETTPETTTKTEQVADVTTSQNTANEAAIQNDSLRQIALKNKLGAFAYGASTSKEGTTLIENDLVKLT